MNSAPEEALFQLALAKPAEKRAAFLDVMCEGDAALRQFNLPGILLKFRKNLIPHCVRGPSRCSRCL